jgi:Tfp pilus assembly protein PilF
VEPRSIERALGWSPRSADCNKYYYKSPQSVGARKVLLISVFNICRDSLEEIKQLLQRNNDVFVATAERTRSLRESTPTMNVPNSIYGGDERERSIYSTAISLVAPSEIEFDFDDQIVNSRVYRRMLAQAMMKTTPSDIEVIEGDLIDFSDVATIKETAIQKEETSSAVRLLEGLVISKQEQNVNNTLEASHDYQRSAPETMELSKWTKESIRFLTAAFPNGDYETWADCQVLLPHAREAISHVTGDEEDVLNQAKIAFSTGWYLCLRGEYKTAEKVVRMSVNVREKVLGPEHHATLASINNLGWVLCSQGKYEEAEAMHRRALEGSEKVLGPENPATLASVDNLGRVLSRQGKYGEAEAMHQQALNTREKVLGPEHPDTLASVDNLGTVLWRQGKDEEAEAMHRRALKAREKVLGTEHPNTLISVDNLGRVLSSQGRYKEAEVIHRQALKTRERVLGPEHPDTLVSINNLGKVLCNQGKNEEAEAMHRRALKAREKVLGPEHPDTLISVNNLGRVLWNQGKDEEAEAMHRRALKAREKVLGPEHPDTLTSVDNLGTVLSSQGKDEEAEVMHRRSLKARGKVLGPA